MNTTIRKLLAAALLLLVASADAHIHGRGVATPAAPGPLVTTDAGVLVTTDAGVDVRIDP